MGFRRVSNGLRQIMNLVLEKICVTRTLKGTYFGAIPIGSARPWVVSQLTTPSFLTRVVTFGGRPFSQYLRADLALH